MPNRRSTWNRTYPGRTNPSDSGREDRKRAKARLWRRQSTLLQVGAITAHQDRRSGTDERLACEAPGRTNSWPERGRGAWSSPSGGSLVPERTEGRRCVDSGFGERRISRCRRNGQGSRRKPNGSVSHGLPCGVWKVGTNRRISPSGKRSCLHEWRDRSWRDMNSGGNTKGDRRTTGRSAMAGRSGSESRKCCHDAVRALAGGRREERVGAFGSRRVPNGRYRHGLGTTPGASGAGIVGQTSRPDGLVFHSSRQRQRHEGMAGRKVLSATWEGKPLKGQTPEALPARNKAGRVSGGATRQEAGKACRRCTAG